jgi:ribosomal protein S18 acetylase RimI-like enzyme
MIGHLIARITRRLGLQFWRVLTRPLGEPAVPPPGMELRVLSPDDARQRWSDAELGLSAEKADEAFARGDVCVGAFDGAALVGYAWFAYRPAPHVDGLWMEFDPRSIYIYRAFVKPRYRGRGIAPALYRFADQRFLAEGRTYAVICVNAHNRASIAAAERSGARASGYSAYFSRGRRFIPVRSRGAARCGFRFYRP